jgi:histone-lysine N-methyltransferase SETD7
VAPSKLPQGGDGLFAKIDRPKGSVVAFYNGIRLNTSSILMSARYGKSDYRIRLNAETDLDIPKGFENVEIYSATLGHKTNHSFDPNCEWIIVEHPRFGLIRGLRSQKDIQKDEELLINYTMNLGDAPEWYRVVWLQHQRHFKRASDEAIGRILARFVQNKN